MRSFKRNQHCNLAEKPGNKSNITSNMGQDIRKMGVVDKALVMSINDNWEDAYGEFEDLHGLKTGQERNEQDHDRHY